MMISPADTLLVADVGNTRVGLSIWDADGLHPTQRFPADDDSAWTAALESLWVQSPAARRAVVVGSVNPPVAARLGAAVERVTGATALRVRDDLPLPLTLDGVNAREVGVDRICSAAAAYERVGGACAIASFGTAITIDCVSEDGRFLGGAIMPGLAMSCRALHEFTAALPRVQLAAPSEPFGKNTFEAILHGVVHGAVGALREIVERYATELRSWPTLVITGGDAALVASQADFVDAVIPDLCLQGIALAHRKAAGATAS